MAHVTRQPEIPSTKHDGDNVDDLKAEMAIEAGLINYGKPIHEMLTLSALINSDYRMDPSITYRLLRAQKTAYLEVNDFIRGAMWNDDPQCLLFKENDSTSNFSYSKGWDWSMAYLNGGFTKPELIHRSHFGDLQWLHAMALGGDMPTDTKNRILVWFEIMYKLAIGLLDADTRLSDTAVHEFFDNPARYNTIGELLTQRHPSPVVISHRALGSCFHVIQDSYATGHVWRERINKDAPSGEPDRRGAILNFHSYGGQNSDEHKHFDHGDSAVDVDYINVSDPDSWNGLSGCRDGLDKCIELANYWNRKAGWNEVYEWLNTVVFKISDKASDSTSSIETD